MRKHIWISAVLIVIFTLIAYFFLKPGAKTPFRFGLDLIGGSELIYEADTTQVSDISGAMESLRQVIERRINVFGVSEPIVQTEKAGILSGHATERLIVELPNINDIEKAKKLIGKTPSLEFWLRKPGAEDILKTNPEARVVDLYNPTSITGRYLTKAQINFNQTTGVPAIGLNFNQEGAELFAAITKEHKGEALAIFLDGIRIQEATIQDEITDGKALITGNFTPEYARQSVRDLNYGALPVPITLISSQTIGASLGEQALVAGLKAGLMGFVALALFLILWYRLPGLIAVLALTSYIILSLFIFKLIPVTLTAAGVAGFILSIGMAVDANVLIFERAKEEKKRGKTTMDAFHEGFKRAWLSIRDSNISSIITAIILFWLGTSAVKGFALTLGIGVLISMITAISVSRTFLFAIYDRH
ncbi:MAG: protein translocase subunit SecD [Candidatus Zambryskibacteria bacterium]|nr:protein translocase subunit SecD [Candidatus Zambryskibacteria bacterium]